MFEDLNVGLTTKGRRHVESLERVPEFDEQKDYPCGSSLVLRAWKDTDGALICETVQDMIWSVGPWLILCLEKDNEYGHDMLTVTVPSSEWKHDPTAADLLDGYFDRDRGIYQP